MNLKMKSKEKKKLFDKSGDDSSSTSSSSSSTSEKIKKPDASTSPSEEEETKVTLTVNKKYARDYQNRKEREELRQIRQRGEDSDNDDSSDEEEDEDGKLLTNSVNLQFLKTMKALKAKETTIYDPKSRFFGETQEADGEETSEKKHKPQRFKDVLRNQILEQMDEDDDDGAKRAAGDKESSKKSKLAYDEQQEQLRKAFLKESKVDGDEGSGSDSDEEDWMVMKGRGVATAKDPKVKEIQDEFEVLEKLSSKQEKKSDFADPRGEVKDGEQFLMDYIKNKKWIDRDAVGDDSDDDVMKGCAPIDNDASSLDDVDRADDFEANYNFRFEQAAAETASSGASFSIQTYARGQTMNTVRRQDTARKDKRTARKERKDTERKAKEEQLKRLKNAKRQEMNHKLSQVKAVLGSVEEEAVDEATLMKMLEGDYDPDKFEKAMQSAYGDDFYQKEDAEWKTDVHVRESLKVDEDGDALVGQDDLDGGMYDNYDGDGNKEEAEDDQGDEEDNEEYVGGDDPESSQLEKKLKTKMQEELYKLDYEDIVAGIPTRFKYRQVEANDYGLTTQEILLARDNSLKQFVSLKKMAPYNEQGEHHVNSKKRRRFREMLKSDLAEEMGEEEEVTQEDEEQAEADETEEPTRKRRRLKKGKKKTKDITDENETGQDTVEIEEKIGKEQGKDETDNRSKGRRKKKGKKGEASHMADTEVTNTEGTNFESIEKSTGEETPILSAEVDAGENEKSEKKKKKRKKKKVAALPSSRLASYGL